METQKTELATVETEVVTVTRDNAEQSLVRLFNALENATGNPLTTLQIIDKFSEGIEADPELSKQIFTPDNIAKVMELKRKSDAGKLSLNDVVNAFPIIGKMVPAPILAMVQTFTKK